MIKCACGDKDCPIEIRLCDKELWMTNKSGEETLMYLDANSTVELIKEAHQALASQIAAATAGS